MLNEAATFAHGEAAAFALSAAAHRPCIFCMVMMVNGSSPPVRL